MGLGKEKKMKEKDGKTDQDESIRPVRFSFCSAIPHFCCPPYPAVIAVVVVVAAAVVAVSIHCTVGVALAESGTHMFTSRARVCGVESITKEIWANSGCILTFGKQDRAKIITRDPSGHYAVVVLQDVGTALVMELAGYRMRKLSRKCL